MAQWVQALTALPEDAGSIPSTQMAAHNYVLFQCQVIQHPLLVPIVTEDTCSTHTCTQTKHPHIKLKMIILKVL